MPLTLHVDAARWRQHLADAIRTNPGIVPVAKGNGYGLGMDVLVHESARLSGQFGLDTIAVGTYAEAPKALEGFPGEVLVMEPYRPRIHADLAHLTAHGLVHTITYAADLSDLVGRIGRPRVVVEGLTSMNRHGIPFGYAGQLLEAAQRDADLLGMTLHLPLPGGTSHLSEVTRWLDAFDVHRWYVSHLTASELATLRRERPDRDLRPRIGTSLWIGDPGALTVRGHVLDVRPVRAGDRAGYRLRRLPAGHLVVVSGGTAHGVAMETPSAVSSVRQRAIALAEGAMEAAGRVRSPFKVGAGYAWFVEPPHMQVSLIAIPASAPAPEVGDELEVRVRLTTLLADGVSIT